MSESTMQDQFEEWAHEKELSLPINRSVGYNQSTQLAWEAWRASRAAVEVTLPERIPPEYRNDYWSGAKNGFNQGVETCRVSIEHAGLKVKA